MLAPGWQAHTGSDGSSLAQRVTDAGYASYADLGEIVFWANGPGGSPAAAVELVDEQPGPPRGHH